MYPRGNGGVRSMGVCGVAIGVYQVPATFVGPLAVHKELHVNGVAVTYRNDRRGVKARGKRVEGTHGAHRKLQLVLRGAKVVAHPTIAEAVRHVKRVRTGVCTGNGGCSHRAHHVGQVIGCTRVVHIELVGRACGETRDGEGIAGRLNHRTRTLRKSARAVFNEASTP